MPHLKLVLETQRSCRPGFRKLFTISFFLETGWMNSGWSSMCFIRRSAYLLILKKYASSLAGCTSRPQSGHLPSTSWDWVQKLSQGVQYRPSYSPL